jgi:hypothetical protein
MALRQRNMAAITLRVIVLTLPAPFVAGFFPARRRQSGLHSSKRVLRHCNTCKHYTRGI